MCSTRNGIPDGRRAVSCAGDLVPLDDLRFQAPQPIGSSRTRQRGYCAHSRTFCITNSGSGQLPVFVNATAPSTVTSMIPPSPFTSSASGPNSSLIRAANLVAAGRKFQGTQYLIRTVLALSIFASSPQGECRDVRFARGGGRACNRRVRKRGEGAACRAALDVRTGASAPHRSATSLRPRSTPRDRSCADEVPRGAGRRS